MILRNPSVQCYVNALALGMLHLHCVVAAAASFPAYDTLSRTVGTTVNLLTLEAWAHCMLSWKDPACMHQQDVGEFAQYALPLLFNRTMPGSWLQLSWDAPLHAWREAVASSLTSPVPMSFPDEANLSLQDLVEIWRTQATRNFLSSDSNLLVLQLGRFRMEQGRECKHRRALRWVGRRLLFPLLDIHSQTGTAELRLERFDVQAIILHHGLSTTSGHYTACLLQDVAGVMQFWSTDDHRAAQMGDMPSSVLTDSYLVLCSRVRASHTEGSSAGRPELRGNPLSG